VPEAQASGQPIWVSKKTSSKTAWNSLSGIFLTLSNLMEIR